MCHVLKLFKNAPIGLKRNKSNKNPRKARWIEQKRKNYEKPISYWRLLPTQSLGGGINMVGATRERSLKFDLSIDQGPFLIDQPL